MKKSTITIIVIGCVVGAFLLFVLPFALITTKMTMGVINESKISTSEDEAYGVVSAAELWYSEYLLENGVGPSTTVFGNGNGQTNFSELKIKGTIPTSGTVEVRSNGEVILNKLEIGNICWSTKELEHLVKVDCD